MLTSRKSEYINSMEKLPGWCVCPACWRHKHPVGSGFLQSWIQAYWRWSPHQLPITLTSALSRRHLEIPEKESSKSLTTVYDIPVFSMNFTVQWVNSIHDKIEMHKSYTKLQAKKIQGWVRGAVGGSKQELLGKLLLYFVFHRHFSKSDQGHLQQQQHPRSLLSVVLPPVIICSFYS